MRKKDTRKTVSIVNLPDFKDRDGFYIKTFSFTDTLSGVKHNYSTRAFSVWSKINSRCLQGGHYQTKSASVCGATNAFKSFDFFAEWCSDQPGYLCKDAPGRYWSLDKDILGDGDKIYSENSCCFIPQYLNKITGTSSAIRGEYPLGVSKVEYTGKFMSYCKTTGNGKREILGYFTEPMIAHHAWQEAKIRALRFAISRYIQEPEVNLRVIDSIETVITAIQTDMLVGRETVCLWNQ